MPWLAATASSFRMWHKRCFRFARVRFSV
jgi:hypothetical protein